VADVVLVHGLWYRAWSLRALARQLTRAGFRVHLFSYPTRTRDLADNARDLAGFCRAIDCREPRFVAHSLGGLVLLHMLGRQPDLPTGRMVLLGTPLRGSAVARRSLGMPGGALLLGRAAPVLAAGHAGSLGGRAVGMLCGTKPLGLGRLTGGLDGPNDGTVLVEETRHDDLADHLQLPVTHTGMLISPSVARQVAWFLHDGAFRQLV
jgi:pimeloyl-ACP methyl ester carboxylesterase